MIASLGKPMEGGESDKTKRSRTSKEYKRYITKDFYFQRKSDMIYTEKESEEKKMNEKLRFLARQQGMRPTTQLETLNSIKEGIPPSSKREERQGGQGRR